MTREAAGSAVIIPRYLWEAVDGQQMTKRQRQNYSTKVLEAFLSLRCRYFHGSRLMTGRPVKGHYRCMSCLRVWKTPYA